MSVEFEPHSRREGDLQQRPADFAVTTFWRVLVGRVPGGSSAAQVTVFDSVGFALQDFAALTWMSGAAAEWELGELLRLVPQVADPKNLFGVLKLKLTPAAAAAKPAEGWQHRASR